MIGSRLGPYQLLAELGSGGMGKVYRAEVAGPVPGLDPGCAVALKVIHAHLLETPGFFKRFLREADLEGAEPVDFRHCAEAGAEFHFCPVCGSTVYYTSDVDDARIGIKIGAFADPTFPPPKITGYIEYRHPWTMDLEGLSLEVVQGKNR